MKLIDNPAQSHRLWSMRFAVMAALFGALELSLPIWLGIVPPSVFAALSTISAALAAVSRVVKQNVDSLD
jgi:hypothetical protein